MGEQYALDLIDHTHGGEVIRQRSRDGYVNATAMCKAAEREFKHYNENKTTKAFLSALSSEVGIPTSELIQTLTGGTPTLQGTWVHPQVAIHLAQWLSPQFAVQVTQWVFEWMSGLGSPMATRRPSLDFLERYNLNSGRVDIGYFSIIGELYVRIYGDLERIGYVLPEYAPDGKLLRPDISVGMTFPAWLEERYPAMVGLRKPYVHLFRDGFTCEAWQYQNGVWPAFMEFMYTEWLPKRAMAYFGNRDAAALPYVETLLASLPSSSSYPQLPPR